MWNEPDKETLSRIPPLYATEEVPTREKIIHLHFFIGGCDWYIAEYDGENLFWGYVILNSDYEMAEWCYISFQMLREARMGPFEVDTDLYWEPRKAGEIEKIKKCRQY